MIGYLTLNPWGMNLIIFIHYNNIHMVIKNVLYDNNKKQPPGIPGVAHGLFYIFLYYLLSDLVPTMIAVSMSVFRSDNLLSSYLYSLDALNVSIYSIAPFGSVLYFSMIVLMVSFFLNILIIPF